MQRLLIILAAAALISTTAPASRTDDKDLTAILDKAIAALGGEAKLTKAMTATWSTTGTITFNENESPIKARTTTDGIDRQRGEIDLDFNGMEVKGVTILDGNKGWRKFGDNSQPLEGEMLAGTKQGAYLSAVATTILPLKTKGFKAEAGPDEKLGDKTAAVIKGTGPDGKTFTLYLDKETGLPIKMTATVPGFQGDDAKMETMYSAYKDYGGVKRATKIESKRDGNPFLKTELSDFKLIEKPAASTFAEPD